jgi:hypothetical protein
MQRLSILFLLVTATGLIAQPPTPHFAIAVINAPSGAALCPQNVAADPAQVLGLSGGGTGTYYLSLCGNGAVEYGLAVTVIDGPGPDLQIEEVNANINENYLVEVSPDATTWYLVPGPYTNQTWAGDAALDIAGTGAPTVNFVRITDASGVTTGNTPGPDFDAILAINYLPPLVGGMPRIFPDAVVSYNQGATTTAQFLDPTRALGPPDAYRSETYVGPGTTTFTGTFYNFVAMGAGAVLVVGFSQDYIVDAPGGDLLVHEYYSPEGTLFTVDASDDGTNWFPMTSLGAVTPPTGPGQAITNNVQSFDLASTGLSRADYFRVVSTSTSTAGATPGADLDALEGVNFVAKDRSLVLMSPLTAGGLGEVLLTTAPFHVGDIAITAPALTPPLPVGSGLIIGPGAELRLAFQDPLLQFVLFDPAAAFFVSGTVSPLAGPSASVQVTLPPDPGLMGVIFYWQSALLPPGGGASTGVSNILPTVIQ